MKTILVDTASSPLPSDWFFLPDSALINAGKPFFIPESMPDMQAQMVLGVKISRLGKTVAPRFANRYFKGVAAGIHFSSPGLLKILRDKGFSPDRARAFDRSLILSEYQTKFLFTPDSPILLMKNGEEVARIVPDLSDEAVGPSLAAVSADNTFKMGDLLIPFLTPPVEVKIGDTLEVMKGNESLLRTEIK